MPVKMFDMPLAFTVLLTGIVTVFIVLIILTIVIKGYGNITNYIYKKEGKKPESLKYESAYDQNMTFTENKPQKKQNQDEIIAAISAAVAYIYADTQTEYKIKSIKKSSDVRTSWRMQGLFENTNPF